MVIGQCGYMPLLLFKCQGRHLLIEAVHVILEYIRLQKITIGMHAMGHTHHEVAVKMGVFLFQYAFRHQVPMQRTNDPRADQSKVKIPIILAKCLCCHPSGSCSCQYAIQAIITLSKSTEDAFDQSQSEHSSAQEDSNSEVLRVQAFFPFSGAFEDGLERTYQLHYTRDDQAVFQIFEGLLESRDDASTVVCAEWSLGVQQLFDEVHWIQRQEIIMLGILPKSNPEIKNMIKINIKTQFSSEQFDHQSSFKRIKWQKQQMSINFIKQI